MLQHQKVLNGGCCVKLAYAARCKAYKAKPLPHILMLWAAEAFCPRDSTVLRDTARILMWFVWSFCKKSCEADQLSCNQPGAWACSGWHLLSLTSKRAGLGSWDWAWSCLVHLQLSYLVLIFHILLYLTRECLQLHFCQSIENFRKCCIFLMGVGGREGRREGGRERGREEGEMCTKCYKAINYYCLHLKQTLVWI